MGHFIPYHQGFARLHVLGVRDATWAGQAHVIMDHDDLFPCPTDVRYIEADSNPRGLFYVGRHGIAHKLGWTNPWARVEQPMGQFVS